MKKEIVVICDNIDATIEISFKKPFSISNEYDLTIFPVNTLLKYYISDQLIIEIKNYVLDRKEKIASVIFCRCSTFEAVKILEALKELEINTKCFLDDDLTDVPIEAGKKIYGYFANSERRQQIEYIVSNTKVILVSTENLKKTLKEKFPDQNIKNLNCYKSIEEKNLLDCKNLFANSDNVIIGYMGSQSHACDIEPLIDDLEYVLLNKSNVYLEFFGTIEVPWKLKKFSSRVIHHDKCNTYVAFLKKLADLKWTYGLAPLNDLPFNHNKADTKWVEYTCANIATIASNVPPYSALIEKGVCINGSKNWRAVLMDAISNPAKANELLVKSKALLRDQYCTENHLSDLLEKITEKI